MGPTPAFVIPKKYIRGACYEIRPNVDPRAECHNRVQSEMHQRPPCPGMDPGPHRMHHPNHYVKHQPDMMMPYPRPIEQRPKFVREKSPYYGYGSPLRVKRN